MLHTAQLAQPDGHAVETVYFKKNVKRDSIKIRWAKLHARPAQVPTGAHQDLSLADTASQDTGWTQVPQKLTDPHHALNAQVDSSAQLVKVLQTLVQRELSPIQAQLNVIHARLATTAQRRPTFQSLAPILTSAQVA